LLFGVGGGAVLSLLSLYNTQKHPTEWVVRAHIGIIASCGLGVAICGAGAIAEFMRYRKRKSDLQSELNLFEEGFDWEKADAPNQSEAQTDEAPRERQNEEEVRQRIERVERR
jgi:hypothetical protein